MPPTDAWYCIIKRDKNQHAIIDTGIRIATMRVHKGYKNETNDTISNWKGKTRNLRIKCSKFDESDSKCNRGKTY